MYIHIFVIEIIKKRNESYITLNILYTSMYRMRYVNLDVSKFSINS